jgi:thiamine biosynthesis lipoprotein ApbE
MALNLGAIGKGFAVQAIGAALWRRGVRHALVSAGGSSVIALGGPDRGWRVDVMGGPQRQRLTGLRLRNAALGTSGAGEQFIEVNGTRYGHVIDPRTGWPASGVLSASVVTADAATADALATGVLRRRPRSRPQVLRLSSRHARFDHARRWQQPAAGRGPVPGRQRRRLKRHGEFFATGDAERAEQALA